MEVTIKDLARRDYKRAIEFAATGMHFDRYIDNNLLLTLYGRYVLYLELERATQVLAAYDGDRLAGVLIAEMKHEPRTHTSIWRRLYAKIAKVVMTIAFKGGPDIYDEANDAMLQEFLKGAAPDGEICFLAADPAIHGKGIGTQLLDEIGSREKGKLVYLYTDENCTYQFYEHKGFERSAEAEIEMDIQGKTVPLMCFLFSKRL